MLRLEEIERIREGAWGLDCPEMTLGKNSGIITYSGPGWIRQAPDGKLSFKLYASQRRGAGMFTYGSGAAGQIIPDTEYYDLRAIDASGRLWEIERLLPQEHWSVDTGTIILSGDLWYLVHRFESTRSDPQALVLRFFTEFEVPLNTATMTRTSVGGTEGTESFSVDTSRFSACGMDFVLKREDQGLTLSATVPQAL